VITSSRKTTKIFAGFIAFTLFLLISEASPSFGADTEFQSLSGLQGKNFVLGDTVKIESEFCWNSNKQNPKYPRLIEARINGKWVGIGKSNFIKLPARCTDEQFPFMKVYTWKIDRLGSVNLRNREKTPFVLADISVFAPGLAPVPTSTSDVQFLYSTGACRNEIGFARFDDLGKLLMRKAIVKSDSNVQLVTQDYDNGVLLFSTFNCDTNETKLYKLGVSNKSLRPSEILSLPKGSFLIDAAWDVATDTPIALLSLSSSSEYVVITADYSKSLLWSSTEQGWSRDGIYPQALLSSTGSEFTVFGNNLSKGGWTSAQVNFGSSRSGRSTQYFGNGEFIDIAHGMLNMPYAIALDSGVYLCRDFPTSGLSRTMLPRESSQDCTLVDSGRVNWRGSLAFSYVKSASKNSTSQILINPQKGSGYAFPNGPIFGEWNQIRLTKTLRLNTYEFIGLTRTFEVSYNIADVAPSLKLKDGYFS